MGNEESNGSELNLKLTPRSAGVPCGVSWNSGGSHTLALSHRRASAQAPVLHSRLVQVNVC